ncbi:MAG TPA: SAM-dependent chlorinase/fluorinase, partial [Flavobacterium sp.]|nr:SAM-dependent chlorinase/fluorinase [Flavobacterium sp.]
LPTDMEVFVKVAVHLSKGGLLNVVGKETSQMNRPTELRAQVSSDKKNIKGFIIYIDHLGNVVTNITKKMFMEAAGSREFEIILNEKTNPGNRTRNITAIYDRYIDGVGRSAIVDGQKIAVFNEAGYLEIGLYRSNAKTTGTASTLLGLSYLDPISIQFN